MNVARNAVRAKLMLLNCEIQSEEQQTGPEGFCSACLGTLSVAKFVESSEMCVLSISGNSYPKHLVWSTTNGSSECFGCYLFVIAQPQMPPEFCHFNSDTFFFSLI